MTERSEPTIADILSAVQTFGEHYHDVSLSLAALHDELAKHDIESRREWAALRDQLHALQRSVDRRFDAFGRELDTHAEQIAALQEVRTETMMRLSDIEARIEQLEKKA